MIKPPLDLSRRFSPAEQAAFRLVRRTCCVRLWESTTVTSTRYHVTREGRCRFQQMPDFEEAVMNFEREAARSTPRASRLPQR